MEKDNYPKIYRNRNKPEIIRIINFLDGLGIKLEIKASEDDWRKLLGYSTGIHSFTRKEVDIKNIPLQFLEDQAKQAKGIKLIHGKFKELLCEGFEHNFLWHVAGVIDGKPSDFKKNIIKSLKIEATLLHEYFDAYKNIEDIPGNIEKIIPGFALRMQTGQIDPIACSAHCMQAVYGKIADYIGLKPFPTLEDPNAQDDLQSFNITYIVDGRKLVKTRLALKFFLEEIDGLILSIKQMDHGPDESIVDFLKVVHATYALDLENPLFEPTLTR